MIFNSVVSGKGGKIETVQIAIDGTGGSPTISFLNADLEFENTGFSIGENFEVVKNSIFYCAPSSGSVGSGSNSVHYITSNTFYADADGTIMMTERS